MYKDNRRQKKMTNNSEKLRLDKSQISKDDPDQVFELLEIIGEGFLILFILLLSTLVVSFENFLAASFCTVKRFQYVNSNGVVYFIL